MFILFDSNVWISQLGLQSENGAAVRYFANRRSATVAIPEVVQLEVEEKLTEHVLKLKKQIEDGHRQLLPLLGKLQPIALPTEDKIRETITSIIPDFDVPIREIPFNLDAARSSMMKLLRKIPPSKSSEQFRDGVIWEHCLELLNEGDVYLVSEDKDFYSERNYEKGMAPELAKEMQQRSKTYKVTLRQNLTRLLAEIGMPIRLNCSQIFESILAQESEAVEDILMPHEFELCGGVEGDVNCFATEEAETVYFTFSLAHPCRDSTGVGRRDGELKLKGSGFLDPETKTPTKVQLSNIRLEYPDWKSDGPARGVVFCQRILTRPRFTAFGFPLTRWRRTDFASLRWTGCLCNSVGFHESAWRCCTREVKILVHVVSKNTNELKTRDSKNL